MKSSRGLQNYRVLVSEKRSYGDLTATGVRAQVNHTIAVDPKIIPYGSEIMIDGQIYVAEDCGGAVKNNVIDVWVEHQSNSFGVKYKEIYIKREK